MPVGPTAGMFIFQVVVAIMMSAASRALSSMLTPDKEAEQAAGGSRGHLANTRDTQAVLPVIFGRCRVGVNWVYMGTTGADNKYIHMIGTICEGEISGIAKTGAVDQLFLNDKLYNNSIYSDLVYYEFFNGTATQDVCSTLHSAIPEWDDPLRYTAYIYLRLKFDGNVFQSIPEVTVEVEGLKIYNTETEITEYSNNPAYAIRDLVTRPTVRGGMEIATSRMDDTSTTDTAAYCATRGWTVGLPLRKKEASIASNISQVLAVFRGAFFYSDNKFKTRYRDVNYESPVMNLDENDIICDGDESSLEVSQPSVFDTPNAVRVKFLNKDKKYQIDDYVKADPVVIDSDGDYREKAIEILGINSYENAIIFANYWLERLRLNKTVSFSAHNKCMTLEPLDLIQLTHSMTGWDNQLLRVLEILFNPTDSTVGLSLIEETATLYDDEYNLTEQDFHTTTLPDPTTVPHSVVNVSHEEEVYYYRERSFTRWKINFSRPDPTDYPWWKHAEIWLKIGDAGEWKYLTKSTSNYQLDPVEEGVRYYIKLVSVSIHEVSQPFGAAYEVSREITGHTDAPSSLSSMSAIAAGDTVTLFADALIEPDIAVYEIRLGSSWDGGIYVGSNETPNFRLVGVRPGIHIFWMNVRGNNKLYSTTPVSASVTVLYPSGYTDKHIWNYDFSVGTFNNTEYALHDGKDSLKCSHTGGVLTGSWKSPEYDMGSLKNMRIFGDFLTTFSSGTTTWDALFPGTTTWDDVTDVDTRWYELISPPVAGYLTAILHYGTVSGSLTESVERFEITSPEINARYVQVEVFLTDPTIDANLYLHTLNMKGIYWL